MYKRERKYIRMCLRPTARNGFDRARACLKNHSRHLHAPLCVIFAPNSGYIARYAPFIWRKSPTNCDAHLSESIFQTRSGVCLKIHSRHLHAPLCGRFVPHSVNVAHYASLIRDKSPANCDAQLTESNFKTHSGGYKHIIFCNDRKYWQIRPPPTGNRIFQTCFSEVRFYKAVPAAEF